MVGDKQDMKTRIVHYPLVGANPACGLDRKLLGEDHVVWLDNIEGFCVSGTGRFSPCQVCIKHPRYALERLGDTEL